MEYIVREYWSGSATFDMASFVCYHDARDYQEKKVKEAKEYSNLIAIGIVFADAPSNPVYVTWIAKGACQHPAIG